jgi:tetratricopeptide (TPR) repeat protein
MGFLAGIRGDKAEGIRKLENVAQNGVLNRYDAEIILAVVYRREHRPQDAIPLLKRASQQFPRNFLLRLEQVQMYSDLGDKRAALQVLAEIERLQKTRSPGYANLPAERTAYSKGNLLFWYGDLDPALAAMNQVTRNTEALDLNTTVMAWLRLGQIYDLKGDRSQAKRAYRMAVNTAPDSAPGKEASEYIENKYQRKKEKS